MYPQNKKLHDDNIALFKQSEMLFHQSGTFWVQSLAFLSTFLEQEKNGSMHLGSCSCIDNAYGMFETLHTTVMIPCVNPIGEMGY